MNNNINNATSLRARREDATSPKGPHAWERGPGRARGRRSAEGPHLHLNSSTSWLVAHSSLPSFCFSQSRQSRRFRRSQM